MTRLPHLSKIDEDNVPGMRRHPTHAMLKQSIWIRPSLSLLSPSSLLKNA